MNKRIFALFVLMLFLMPSVALSQETSLPPESPSTEQPPTPPPTEPSSPPPTDSGLTPLLPVEPKISSPTPPPTEQPKIEQPPQQKCPPEKGCIRNYRCMGAGTATGQINVPQGCKKVENEYSVQIVCEQDQQFSNIKADKEKSCVQSGGRFSVREDGSFDCSFEGKQGFFQPVQCPTPEEQKKVEQECRNKGGQEEYFMDKSGCTFFCSSGVG